MDVSAAEISEFPSFVGCSIGDTAHILIGSLSTADIGPYLAFATRGLASVLNLYVPPSAIPGVSASSFSAVVGALGLQGEGFEISVEVLMVEREGLKPVVGGTTLQSVIQDDIASREFLTHPGAAEVVEIVLGNRCEAFFIGDRMYVTHLGLEVARSIWVDGRLALEVGVGRNDRMARSWLKDPRTQDEQLKDVVQTVNRYRMGSSQFHPLARLATARWMRLAIQDDPSLISVQQLTPLELVRTGNWPTRGLWSLKTGSEFNDEDAIMYRGFDTSFEEDDLAFAIAIDSADALHVVGISAGVDLGAVAKLYEVARSLADQGRKVDGSILVVQERNRIVPIERLVNLAGFRLRSVTLSPTWKKIDPE